MHINWCAITIISIWILATLGAFATKKVKVYEYAAEITFLIGIGYFLMRTK